jgi:hypothetical protein
VLYALATGCFGLSAAVLVWRTGGLSAAIGLHTGLNLASLTIAGAPGPLSGLQLYTYVAGQGGGLLAVDVAASAVLLGWTLSRWGRLGLSGRDGRPPAHLD